jgi:hypothetical protein
MEQLADGYERALGTSARNRLSPHPSVVKVGSGTESVHAA